MSRIDTDPRRIDPKELIGKRRGFTRGQLLAAFGSAAVAVLVPTLARRANAAAIDLGGFLGITDLRGVTVVSAPGVLVRVSGNFDLADHPPFRSELQVQPGDPYPLLNVLAEPGGFLANRSVIEKDELQNLVAWDAKVARGEAEYIEMSGPDVNFYNFENKSAPGLRRDIIDGSSKFDLAVAPHRIIRVDAEEAWIWVNGQQVDLNQASVTPGQEAHHTLIIRSPYDRESLFQMKMITVPGTQVQIIGNKVARPTAFYSQEAALQGTWDRQARPSHPRYFMHTWNVNDGTFGSVESPSPGHLFRHLGNNYLP